MWVDFCLICAYYLKNQQSCVLNLNTACRGVCEKFIPLVEKRREENSHAQEK